VGSRILVPIVVVAALAGCTTHLRAAAHGFHASREAGWGGELAGTVAGGFAPAQVEATLTAMRLDDRVHVAVLPGIVYESAPDAIGARLGLSLGPNVGAGEVHLETRLSAAVFMALARRETRAGVEATTVGVEIFAAAVGDIGVLGAGIVIGWRETEEILRSHED
jgi:hypothetical protein